MNHGNHILTYFRGWWIVNSWETQGIKGREYYLENFDFNREIDIDDKIYVQTLDQLTEDAYNTFENAIEDFQKRINDDK